MVKRMNYLQKIASAVLRRINYEPGGFDGGAAWDLVDKYISPLTSFLLLLVPVVAIAAALYTYIQWALKDEDERDQRPYGKSLKKIILGAVIAESITIIFKIFGL